MISNNHDDLLSEMGASLSLNLTFDENGMCDLVFDEDTLITIRSSEDDGNIILSTALFEELPEPMSFNLVQTLLSMSLSPCMNNGGNSPVVGIDEDSGLVVLYQVCTASLLNKEKLLNIFTEFVQAKLVLTDSLSEDNSADTEISDSNTLNNNDMFA